MTEERDFRFWPREKWNESQKMKEGEGNEVFFLSSPPPPRLLAPIFRAVFALVPRSLLRNIPETLATVLTICYKQDRIYRCGEFDYIFQFQS